MMHKLNGRLRLLTASAALAMVMAATAPAFAETPKDTLVEAFAIDDVISMDPGEAFELTSVGHIGVDDQGFPTGQGADLGNQRFL